MVGAEARLNPDGVMELTPKGFLIRGRAGGRRLQDSGLKAPLPCGCCFPRRAVSSAGGGLGSTWFMKSHDRFAERNTREVATHSPSEKYVAYEIVRQVH